MHSLSGDALLATICSTYTAEDSPLLFHIPLSERYPDDNGFISRFTTDTQLEIEERRDQAKFIWPCIEKYILAIQADSVDPVIAESIDIWPDIIADTQLDHRAAFLVNTSSDQADRIISNRGSDARHWMYRDNYSDDRIKAWSNFNITRGKLIRKLAKTVGYLCVDLVEVTFDEGQAIAKDYLLTR